MVVFGDVRSVCSYTALELDCHKLGVRVNVEQTHCYLTMPSCMCISLMMAEGLKVQERSSVEGGNILCF